jgi:hypothetical protein
MRPDGRENMSFNGQCFEDLTLGRLFFWETDPRRGLRAASRRLALVLPLAISLLSLSALAYGSPPDPVWIPGIYDDADYDDVVVMLTDLSKGMEPPAPFVQIRPCAVVVGVFRSVAAPPSALTASLARHFRSPPLS